MAKANMTRKWINANYFCCSAGYCDLQYLLHFQHADFYTCGVYGWNMDVYTFGDYAITTGYRGMIDNVEKDYSGLIHEYNRKAKEILDRRLNLEAEDFDTYYKRQKTEVNALLREFLAKVFDVSEERFYFI